MLNQSCAFVAQEKPQVLLVDDEPQVLVALEDMLGDDFVVYATDRPERALRLVEEKPEIAVVVSDQRMPQMNGNELLSRLRECSPASRVLSTGYADISAVMNAVNDGRIFAYVTKPWDANDVRQKVQHAAEHFRLNRTLAEERQLLHDLMTSMPDAIFFKDKEGRFVRVNEGMLSLTGAGDTEQLLGRRLSDVMPASALVQELELAETAVMNGGDGRREFQHRHPRHGQEKWLATTTAAIHSASGVVVGLVGMSRDISERIRTEEALRASEARLQLAFAASNATLFDWNVTTGEMTYWGGSRGLRPEAGPTRLGLDSLLSLIHPEDTSKLKQAIAAHLSRRVPFQAVELRAGQSEGQHRWFEVNAQATWDERGEALRLVGSSVDVTTRKEHAAQQARLEFLASYDDLTALPNRTLWTARLERRLHANTDEAPRSVALVLLDLVRLRVVNETLGRSSGDALLREVAIRLSAALGPNDTLARHEGSAFAVVLNDVKDESDVAQWLTQKVYPRLNEVLLLEDTEFRIAAHAGVAIYPGDGSSVAQLTANAEAALGKAKHGGRPYLFYTPSMNSRVAQRLTLELKLRRALEQQEFLLFYQPKVQLNTGRVVGLEALIRWRDSERGLVAPGEFIPLLEETGMILDVGAWVLREAARQYGAWVGAGLQPPRIAVNVSAIQLSQPTFVESLERVLAEAPLAASGLDLELTESVFVDDLAGNIQKLHAARNLGLRIALDDFGTGYSCLGYLSRMPLDVLKIDRSFVASMTEDPQQMSIVTTIISLAHALDLKVVAEGVETPMQAQLLRLTRCDEMQGYLLAKPMPSEEAAALLTRTFDFRSQVSD
jgi:diguanylate cyclase (GGDEF)-like protein/PAS domain S-box-containing protein